MIKHVRLLPAVTGRRSREQEEVHTKSAHLRDLCKRLEGVVAVGKGKGLEGIPKGICWVVASSQRDGQANLRAFSVTDRGACHLSMEVLLESLTKFDCQNFLYSFIYNYSKIF